MWPKETQQNRWLLSAWACLMTGLLVVAGNGVLFSDERIPLADPPEDVADQAYFDLADEREPLVLPAALLQPTPSLLPRIDSTRVPTLRARSTAPRTLGSTEPQQALRPLNPFARGDTILRAEATARVATDLGNLLKKSRSALSVEVQNKGPDTNDPRIRSARVASLTASSSHWVPARIDLDTPISKFDSRQVAETQVIAGPYSALHGPSFNTIDVQLLESPRYKGGFAVHGESGGDFQANGRQAFVQQSGSVGGEQWGASANYLYRTGDDYTTGRGTSVAAGYNTSELLLSLGRDFGESQSMEFGALRLDQWDVELPGYAFDIRNLRTDAYEWTWRSSANSWSDGGETELWYNRTNFTGDNQSPAKAIQFPLFVRLPYVGFTNVDSLSAGYRQLYHWGGDTDGYRLTVGHDLRFVQQELNEVASGRALGAMGNFTNRNSPIPQSYIANPGVFAEYEEEIDEVWQVRAGGRIDYANADITDRDTKLAVIGFDDPAATYANVMGTPEYEAHYLMPSLFTTVDRKFDEHWVGTINVGYAERPPNLTELYAAQPFMFLLQNGLNNVTGDPRLKDEKLIQLDLSLNYKSHELHAGVRGFHAWAFDYITFENTRIVRGPPVAAVQQVYLRYVNTDLATLTGGEAYADLWPDDAISPFITTRYVDGRDRTRNGDFATTVGTSANASTRDYGAIRGSKSGGIGAPEEPLPGISPLETRVGIRLNDPSPRREWNHELSARIVSPQDRVATSLLETPTGGFTVWDLRTVFRPAANRGLTLVLGVENFTDKFYREHLDFRSATGYTVYQPGVNFYSGMNLVY